MARGLLIVNTQKGFHSNVCMAISATHGVIAATTSDHDGEKAHEWFGIGRWDVTDYRFGERI